jgi:hypothetical protein
VFIVYQCVKKTSDHSKSYDELPDNVISGSDDTDQGTKENTAHIRQMSLGCGNHSKIYDELPNSAAPGSALSEVTELRMEENTTHTGETSLGCGNSGESETRLTEDTDISIGIEDDTAYAIDVSFAEVFHCRICEPLPKWYERHGDLSKHIRRYHARRLIFRCHGCSEVFVTLKGCKRYQLTTDCGKLPVVV